MVELFGVPEAHARPRMGRLSQAARVDCFQVTNGAAVGTRLLRVVSGGGLEVEVHPDRSLDIGAVTIDGMPIAWMSPVGMVHPAAYDASGKNWLRTFGGGFLATCGLDNHGPAGVQGDAEFGLHGRIGATPAEIVTAGRVGDDLVVEAIVRQAAVLGENLELRRRIVVPVGGSEISIRDEVTNLAPVEQPHMILYHVNLGWPLLSEDARLSVSSVSATPRDDDARVGAERWAEITAPERGYRERVYLHEFAPGAEVATATLANPSCGKELEMSFATATLPALAQWKMLNENHYVLGLEPTNVAHLTGRAAAGDGVIPTLAPGETTGYDLVVRLRDL